ncbi:MAG: hypothetical protein E7632_02105 [Ruminococcaceae bacterium]|nr:hypothetical protein [Oscillospiraceae bacterium]
MALIDKRSKLDILNELKERSASYTPEWRFRPDDPDIAAVLAMVYADMVSGTLKKVNQIPLKNKIAFFNTANVSLLPAEPSEGYVKFNLASGDSADTEVAMGTVLAAPSNTDDTVHFETTDDILVSQAQIDSIICTDDSADYIGKYSDFRENSLLLFDKSPENLQHHQMTLRHPFVFDIGADSSIRIRFCRRGGILVPPADVKALADPASARIEYYAGEETGYVRFASCREENGVLVLKPAEKMPLPASDENGSFAIRITALDMHRFRDFAFMRVTASSECGLVTCDTVTDGSVEYRKDSFFPFGERFQLYNEVYFGAHEALCKRGAQITVSFDVSFLNIPMENPLPEDEVSYKWIADKSDFKESREHEIAITEVIWEYYNGQGWRRLFADDAHSDLFSVKQGVREMYKTMSFTCPEDIAPVFIGASENYFIRARILKAENLYKLRGHYLTPSVRNLSFAYEWQDDGRTVDDIICENNIAESVFDPAAMTDEAGFLPFRCTGVDQAAVYLGFDIPPKNGPYRILWSIRETPAAENPRLAWEYFAGGKWKPFNLVDETHSFTKVGFTIFLDNHDMTRTRLFGEERYFIRIVDTENAYRSGSAFLPIVESIYENTVRAANVDSREEERFTMSVYTENSEFILANRSILELSVEVNETASISREETARLDAEGRLHREYDENGMVTDIWVKWRETDTFIGESPSSRVYTIDRSRGVLTFGNGRQGRIPAASDTENIRVYYSTGGGKRSNVDVGQISNLERSVGFITGVANPKKFAGGCDTETLADAMKRAASLIRTQGRAVTARDYEKLAKLASRSIRGVHCCPGCNLRGEHENGAVTLVVLRDADAEFDRIRTDILRELTPKIASGIAVRHKLYVTEPEFVSINVRAVIRVASANDVCDVRRAVEEKLRELLSIGETDVEQLGDRLGRLPSAQHIRSGIMSLDGVLQLTSIHITTYVAGPSGLTEIDAEQLERRRFILPANGTHDITITVT